MDMFFADVLQSFQFPPDPLLLPRALFALIVASNPFRRPLSFFNILRTILG